MGSCNAKCALRAHMSGCTPSASWLARVSTSLSPGRTSRAPGTARRTPLCFEWCRTEGSRACCSQMAPPLSPSASATQASPAPHLSTPLRHPSLSSSPPHSQLLCSPLSQLHSSTPLSTPLSHPSLNFSLEAFSQLLFSTPFSTPLLQPFLNSSSSPLPTPLCSMAAIRAPQATTSSRRSTARYNATPALAARSAWAQPSPPSHGLASAASWWTRTRLTSTHAPSSSPAPTAHRNVTAWEGGGPGPQRRSRGYGRAGG